MAITGRTVIATLLGVVLVVLRPQASSVGLWLLAVAAAVAIDLALAPSPRRLSITRQQPVPVRVGEPTSASLKVSNTGRRRQRLLLRDAWQPSAGASNNRFHFRLPAHESVKLTTPLTPTRRGDRYADRVTVRSYGPLGLAARQTGFDCPGSVRSLPAFRSRKHLPSRLAKLQQLDGRAPVRLRGQGTEFDSLRDYVQGDDVRSIDWRATARRRALVVRTWRPERDRRIVVVVDSSRVSAGRIDDAPRLDAFLDAAQFLAAIAERAGDRVGLVAGDRQVRVSLPALRTEVLARFTNALADVQPELVEANWSNLATAVAKLGRRHSLIVLLTALEPAMIEESLAPALDAFVGRGRVVLASVNDPELAAVAQRRATPEQVYQAASAEQTWLERQRVSDVLAALGVHVLEAPPAELPVALADYYLALKSKGML